MSFQTVEQIWKDIIACLQMARIYGTSHPKVAGVFKNTFVSLSQVLAKENELVIGIVGQEFAWGQEIFFELSKRSTGVIRLLKDKGLEKIVLSRGLTLEEFTGFIGYLAEKDQPDAGNAADRGFESPGAHIRAGKLSLAPKSTASAEVAEAVRYLKAYESSLDSVTSSLGDLLEGKAVDALDFRFVMTDIMESLGGRHREFLKLEEVKRRDLATFIHLLNVSILAMNFAGREGYAKEDVLEIGLAALFHDVGKLYITGLVKKKERLSDAEFSRVQSHPVLGAQIMLRYVDSLGILPVVVAFEHHLRFNLKGYPKLTFKKEPHPVSLMVAVCDVYDALLARRSYKKGYSPSDAYQIMKKERGEMFEPGLFDRFFSFTGVWPQGTILALSDGRKAIVRRQNPDDIFLPVVEVVDTSGLGETIDLYKYKGIPEIVKALDPHEEGRPYLGFV